jgi:hypothetical protein
VDSLKALDPNRPIREADIAYVVFDVAFGGKRTYLFASHMSAFDPKRTLPRPFPVPV